MRPSVNALWQTLALGATAAWAAPALQTAQQLLDTRRSSDGIQPSYNVSSCPGYKLVGEPEEAESGFTAKLALAGKACNAYGVDIHNLTLAVVYEKPEQLHVHIYDTAKNQYQLPNGLVFDRPGDDPSEKGFSTADESHLEFHHTGTGKSPWAFWITRKSNGEVIFDTRQEMIPTYDTPLNETETRRNTTAMPAHPIIFENQYLQLSSALPKNAYIYGLGEYISGGFRRDNNATIQPFFTLDAGDPVDSNMYGYHPVYIEARQNGSDVKTHSVYYQNTAGLDVLLRSGVVQYRAIGGTLDFRFFSGDESSSGNKRAAIEAPEPRSSSASSTANSAVKAISQYVSFIGKPIMVPRWSLGFHLCRWGYKTANETLKIAKEMREHDIPLEVQWNDIDYMNEFRDWTIDPKNYSQSDYNTLIEYLHKHKQHYIPIVDAAIAVYPPTSDDEYYPTTTGAELDTFIKNANGTIYDGQVWPGTARFPAWNAPNTQKWWTESVKNFSSLVDFDGIWLDMNEPSSFCVGSCGSGNKIADYAVPTSVGGWPEGYDNKTYGGSGNLTVNGSYTFKKGYLTETLSKRSEVQTELTQGGLTKRASSVKVPHYNYQNETQRYVNVPPYAIHNGVNNGVFNLATNLDMKTAAMDSLTHGVESYDLHNLFGTLEEKATYNALLDLKPKERPFLISRSTYPGAGKYTHHWLGDNYSLWSYAYRSLQGILQFQIYGIPMVGPDCVGFARNTDEELANRWQQMCAMINPFFRNHNTISALSQEPFRWDSVAKASRKANYKRLELLPYYYSTMARASQHGTPAVRPLWYDFPSTFADTGATDSQVLFGPSLLVTPVLEPNVTSVKGYFPSAGGKWRNVFTYEALDVPANRNVSIPAALGNINAHVRPGAALLTHAEPKYTTEESAEGPYGLLVNLNDEGKAEGDFYLDDGHTMDADYTDLSVSVASGALKSSASGKYDIPQKLASVLLLGVESKPDSVKLDGDAVKAFKYDGSKQMLNVTLSGADLNKEFSLTWA